MACGHNSETQQAPSSIPETKRVTRCTDEIVSLGNKAFKVNILTDQPEPIADGTYGFDGYLD